MIVRPQPGRAVVFPARLQRGAVEGIHSRTLRHKLKSMLVEQAQTGYTQLLAEAVINADYATSDQAGFKQAWTLYQTNAAKIDNYRRGKLIDQQSARTGFLMARVFAYSALLVSLFSLLRGGH